MFCPQCGVEAGEGATTCAACGWKKSGSTLWLVLGIVFGFLFLVCCGLGTWGIIKAKKAVEAMQDEIVPLQLSILHMQVVNYAKVHGKAPATLEEAAAEPMVSKEGEKIEIKFQNKGKTADFWQHPIRFTTAPDRSFEVRSAGPDGKFDNADDLVEKGTLDDDIAVLQKDVEARVEKMGKGFMKEFGVDVDELERKSRERREKETKKDGPGDAPPAPAPDEGGGGK